MSTDYNVASMLERPGTNTIMLPAVIFSMAIVVMVLGIYTHIIRGSCMHLYDSYEDDGLFSDKNIYQTSKWTTNVVLGFNVGLFMSYFTPNSTVRKPSLIIFAIVLGILSFQTIWYLYKLNDQNCPDGVEEVQTAFPIFYSYFGWSIGVLIGTMAESFFGGYSWVSQFRIGSTVLCIQIITILGLGWLTVDQCHDALEDGTIQPNPELKRATELYKNWAGTLSIISIVIMIIILAMYAIYPESKPDVNRI